MTYEAPSSDPVSVRGGAPGEFLVCAELVGVATQPAATRSASKTGKTFARVGALKADFNRKSGRGGGIRTLDLVLPKHAR